MNGSDTSKYSKGGSARRDALSAHRRREIARAAARARWGNQTGRLLPKILCGSSDRKIRVAPLDLEIECYVIEGERRLLERTGVISLLSLDQSLSGCDDPIIAFLAARTLEPYVSQELVTDITCPVKFLGSTGTTTYGYEVGCLYAVLIAVVAASADDKLLKQHAHIARRCEILLSLWSCSGFEALVDEVTGFEYVMAAQGKPKKQLRVLKLLKKIQSRSHMAHVRSDL